MPFETVKRAGRLLAVHRMNVGHPTTLDQAVVDAEAVLLLATDGHQRTMAQLAKRTGLTAKEVCIVLYGKAPE